MPDAEIEAVARAIYDAVDTISGDTIATVISMPSHLFETIDDGETEVEAVLRATMSVCRDAARGAAIAALDKARGDGWRTMDDAPTRALLIAGKHIAVKLAEVYRAAGQAPGACQALRDFSAAVQAIESRGPNAPPLPAPPTTEGE